MFFRGQKVEAQGGRATLPAMVPAGPGHGARAGTHPAAAAGQIGGGRGGYPTARVRPFQKGSRSTRLRIFPLGLRGSASMKSTLLGHL